MFCRKYSLDKINLYFVQALGVFGLCQIHALVDYLRSKMSQDDFEILFRGLVISVVSISFVLGVMLTITGIYNNDNIFL